MNDRSDESYITQNEAIKYLKNKGIPASLSTIKRYRVTKGLKAYRFGRTIRYRTQDLDTWVNQQALDKE